MSAITQTLFDYNGNLLAYTNYKVEHVLWRHLGVGVVQAFADYNDPFATKRYLRPGNLLRLQFDNGLPDWAGVMDTPRGQTDSGISITVYEGFKKLEWRVSSKSEGYSAEAPGTIAETLIDTANATEATGVITGDINTSGAQSRVYHYDELSGAITGLVESGYEYAIMPVIEDSNLRFYFQWYETYGQDLSDEVLLFSGRKGNVGYVRMDEQGPIWNSVIVAGKGSWDASHPVATAEDDASVAQYGTRQFPVIESSIDDEATLQAIADSFISEYAWPRKRFQLVGVTNRSPSLYSAYHIGDRVQLNAFVGKGEWEFDGTIRILSRQWNDEDGSCVLEAKEWLGD